MCSLQVLFSFIPFDPAGEFAVPTCRFQTTEGIPSDLAVFQRFQPLDQRLPIIRIQNSQPFAFYSNKLNGLQSLYTKS